MFSDFKVVSDIFVYSFEIHIFLDKHVFYIQFVYIYLFTKNLLRKNAIIL